jgi:hypothetical protein
MEFLLVGFKSAKRRMSAAFSPLGFIPPREEGWLRHQENLGEANLNAADGVVKMHS